jgi:uncharacterized membrane protein
MTVWRKFLVGAVGALSLLGAAAAPVGADGRGDRLITFDSMTTVGHPPTTERGIPGGGAAWSITSATGSVDRQGDVSVTVNGLIVTVLGRNPIGTFEAVVSCVTPDGVMNVETAGAAASMTGDSTIDATVDLPHPCKDPVVFVGGSPGGSFIWFAKTSG